VAILCSIKLVVVKAEAVTTMEVASTKQEGARTLVVDAVEAWAPKSEEGST
jgi:hypothetical protein